VIPKSCCDNQYIGKNRSGVVLDLSRSQGWEKSLIKEDCATHNVKQISLRPVI
jgi:hypothetical protein